MSSLIRSSGPCLPVPQKLRLTRLPGNRVMTEQMSFNVHDVDRYGGKEAVMGAVKAALMHQFHLRDIDVAVLQIVDPRQRDRACVSCLAYLDGNKEPTDEVSAMRHYRAAADDIPVPAFIDI